MKATLIIPDSNARPAVVTLKRSRLTWTMDHHRTHYDGGVLLYPDGDILDGYHFRTLSEIYGAIIETDDRKKVCGALGVPDGEPGIIKTSD